MNRAVLVSLVAALAAPLPSAILGAQDHKPAPAPALSLGPIAGQRVPILPLTMLVAEAPTDELLPGDHQERLRWADELIGAMFTERGPEVTWVLPPELRRVAHRAPAMVTDPDRMGQALLRGKLDRVPDPLRAYLRALAAMTDARLVMVPAAVRISTDSTGTVRAEAILVLADTRNGAIVWRSEPVGTGSTPAEALKASIGRVLLSFD